MKVWFKYGIGAYGGTIDEATFRPQVRRLASIMRKWVMPKLTDQNTAFGAIGKNLGLVWAAAAPGYKADFLLYAQRYFTEHLQDSEFDPIKSRYGHFTAMMYAWQKSDPTHIDLATVTVDDILLSAAPVKCVDFAIEALFLPEIAEYSDLVNPIEV